MNKNLYQEQKMDFLDSLQPYELRNGESFNQLEMIIDNINQAFYRAFLNKENHEEFIKKAFTNLFREESPAIEKAIDLAKFYLKMRQ